MIATINKDGCVVEFASYDLCIDREVVMASVKNIEWALKFASEDLKRDR